MQPGNESEMVLATRVATSKCVCRQCLFSGGTANFTMTESASKNEIKM